MFGDIIVGVLGNTAHDILKRLFKKYFVKEEDPIYHVFVETVKTTSNYFFEFYGDTYGTINSCFLSKEHNWDVILSIIFYGSQEIDENSFDFSGLGIHKTDALSGAKHFVEMLNIQMRKNWQLDKILTEKKHISDTEKYLPLIWDAINSKQPHRSKYPTMLVDQKINEELKIICKSRFYAEYDIVRSSLALGRKLIDGELSGGTNSEKSRVMAWCARFLSSKGEILKAKEYIEFADSLGFCSEVDIAKAFIYMFTGDKNKAMSMLAEIDTSISKSACLFVILHHEGAKQTIDWLETAGISVGELDAYGKYLVLNQCLKLSNWNLADQVIYTLNDQDMDECPILYHMIGLYNLNFSVPTELWQTVLNQVPFQALDFPLASDVNAIHTRRVAKRYFTEAAEVARHINCLGAAAVDEEYALWLDLRDTDNSEAARRLLESKLHDPKSLRLVPLALQFRIKLDLKAVEQQIERQIALHGGITYEAAVARYALAFTKKTPNDAAHYISRHFDELTKYFDKKSLQFFQIDLFLQAGFRERANECLTELLREGISIDEENRIRIRIADVEGTDPLESRKLQFQQTDSLNDLVPLVDELEYREEWGSLCEYGRILFERTRSIQDAERLAKALTNENKSEQLVEFINANIDLLDQSTSLRLMYAWALYHEGNLLESRSELTKLKDGQKDRNYRILQVGLGITLGDWHSLSAFINNEILEKENRSSQELIGTAYLALQLNLQHYAKDLIYTAVARGNDDSSVYTSAYFLATKAGWEDNVEVSQWLHKAVESSDDDGPIRRMTLKDIVDLKPDWNHLESETWQLLGSGKIPQFIAAHSLNKSLIGLMLFPALTNLQLKSDPRRRGNISAYSGKRLPKRIEEMRVIGMDATALLTLGFLNLLNQTFNAFNEVHIPHSTLKWLFEEKQKIIFHQPSRIRLAEQLRNMLSTDILVKFVSKSSPTSDLSFQVGDELAMLITEAEKVRQDTSTQSFVVRPYPVHRPDSLMEEEADLSKYGDIMSSCMSVVNMLRKMGQITSEEEKRARAYLELHEKPWPFQPVITDGATLYLDDLTVYYFQHLGLLEKLKAAGFRPIVSPFAIDRANELITYESISGRIDEIVEQIRSSVNTRIESGKIKVGKLLNNEVLEEESKISEHPTFGIMALAAKCDVIITDDRFFNQHNHIEFGEMQAHVSTTLEVIDLLTSKGIITTNDRFEYKTLLRRAGYLLIPIEENEVLAFLEDSAVVNGKVIETAELKAIRENILCVRMGNWLQLPDEAHWLNNIYEIYYKVLKSYWKSKADLPTVIAYSNWILDQLDIRGWAHRFENGDYFVNSGRGLFIIMLITPPLDVQQNIRDEYWNWITNRVLVPIKEQYHDLFDWIVEWHKDQIKEITDEKHTGDNGLEDIQFGRTAIVQVALSLLPPIIREALLENRVLRETYELFTDAILNLNGSDIFFQRSELFNVIRTINLDAPDGEIIDTKGREWKISIKEKDKPVLVISNDNQNIILPDFLQLLNDSTIRLHSLDEVTTDLTYPIISKNKWHNILSERAFEDEEIDEYYDDITATPVYKARAISKEIAKGEFSISTLIPSTRKYYERLVGCYDGSMTIKEYAAGQCKQHFEQLIALNSYEGLLMCLYLSLHSDLTAEIKMEQLETDEIVRVFDFLVSNGDSVSKLGAIEIGLRILPSKPEIEHYIILLIKQIRDDNVDGSTNGIKLFSALFILVDGELSRIRLFSNDPPFYRRLASLSHAALIHRQLINSGINIDLFFDWALNSRGEQFFFQSLADMRTEPRWNPDFALASQIKAEFLGRIINAAYKYEKNLNSLELYDLLLGTTSESLSKYEEIRQMYLPGPLEGLEGSTPQIPHDISDKIETQLKTEEIGPLSFIALVNSALIFGVETNHAELASCVLKLGSYRLTEVKDRTQLFALLNGLATVAAVGRSSSLANELRILVRVYRHDAQFSLRIVEVLRICLVAAACYENMDNWREFVGEWLTELAFSKMDEDEIIAFHSHLQCLFHVVPELWVTCGRADAALSALNVI